MIRDSHAWCDNCKSPPAAPCYDRRMPPAQQGHAYSWRGEKVIALAHGSRVEVRTIDDGWWGRKFTADAIELEPLPMVYFHNEVPA